MENNGWDDDVVRDVLVIGGGSAGLSAAIALARFGRRVEVVDAGEPRNATAAAMHNVLGHDGRSPLELLRLGREELARFGGRLVRDIAVSAARVDAGFAVTLASGGRLVARRLIVTSGARDRLPAVDGLRERWGRDVLHCPYCHGFEVRGEAIGVLATVAEVAVHQALMFRELSDDVVVFVAAGVEFSQQQQAELAAMDIGVEGEVVAVEVADDRLSGVRLADGRVVARQALVVGPDVDVTNPVLDTLGVPKSDDPRSGYEHDAMGATPVGGVFVAGNTAEPFATVPLASASGLMAGSFVNADLIAERVRLAVGAVAVRA